MTITLERIDHATDDARALVAELDATMGAIYSTEQRHGLSIDRIFQPNIAFFVAYLDGDAAGCGGIAFEEGYAEVKRMFVRPAVRGKGVAQAILTRVEQEARARGYTRLALETGDAQHAALRVYDRAGFERCTAFGDYEMLRPHAIERSVFLHKTLT